MIKTYLFTKDKVTEDVQLDGWQSLVAEECSLLWVDLRHFDRAEISDLAQRLGLHSIAVESCIDRFRRPHLYEFQDHFYVNLTTVRKRRTAQDAFPSELHLFVGEKFIITASKDKDSPAVESALSQYRETPGLCAKGSMHAVYLLAEDLVATYFPLIEKLDGEAEKIETMMLDKADRDSLKKLFDLKRYGFEMRKLLGPQRDVFNELARRDFSFITANNNDIYFQDLYNRMIRIFDMLDTVREVLSGSLDIYLSTISNRLNEVMKVLTVAAIVLMTLSFITGFYGMNFVHIPWLQSPNAFRNILIAMGVITVGMFAWFRRKGWV